MQAAITYTPAVQTHTHVRAETRLTSGSPWSLWEEVPTGNPITPITLAAGLSLDVRLISVNGADSSPPSPFVTVSYDAGIAALATPPPVLDPPSNIGVVYSN